MHNLIILYAPDSAETRKVVEDVKAAFAEAHFDPVAKKAAESSITDVAAVDVVLFGIRKSGASELPPDFADILRASRGANLAGKTAAFFWFGSEKGSERFREIMRDSDIALFDEEAAFTHAASGKSPDAREWAKAVAAFHNGARHAGK